MREVAEKVLRRCLEEDTIHRWPEGSGQKIRGAGGNTRSGVIYRWEKDRGSDTSSG